MESTDRIQFSSSNSKATIHLQEVSTHSFHMNRSCNLSRQQIIENIGLQEVQKAKFDHLCDSHKECVTKVQDWVLSINPRALKSVFCHATKDKIANKSFDKMGKQISYLINGDTNIYLGCANSQGTKKHNYNATQPLTMTYVSFYIGSQLDYEK